MRTSVPHQNTGTPADALLTRSATLNRFVTVASAASDASSAISLCRVQAVPAGFIRRAVPGVTNSACELLAWTQMLALTGTARRWEPRRLRLRLFSVAGRLARSARRLRLRLAQRWPWADQITAAATRLQALPPANQQQPSLRHRRSNPGARGTRPPGATAGQPATARTRKQPPAEQLRPARQAHERSRLAPSAPDQQRLANLSHGVPLLCGTHEKPPCNQAPPRLTRARAFRRIKTGLSRI